MFSKAKIGIDLGTANILIYSSKGIILNEPSVIAIDENTKEIIATGQDARQMIGRTPKNIIALHPLQAGVIADYDLTAQLIKQLLKKASKKAGLTIRKPTVVICTPTNSTDVERRAIKEAITSYGVKQVHLIEEPIAAAIGTGLHVEDPIASVVVDIGGGTTEVGIISLGGVVSSTAIRIGGDNLDDDIIQYIRNKYNVLIGQRTAEEMKVTIGYAHLDHDEETMKVRGREMVSGLPITIEVTSVEIYNALKTSLIKIVETIRETLEKCPPELSGDIVEFGITLTGGGALLNGIDRWLANELDVPIHIAENPLESVAIGTGKSLDIMSKLEKVGK